MGYFVLFTNKLMLLLGLTFALKFCRSRHLCAYDLYVTENGSKIISVCGSNGCKNLAHKTNYILVRLTN